MSNSKNFCLSSLSVKKKANKNKPVKLLHCNHQENILFATKHNTSRENFDVKMVGICSEYIILFIIFLIFILFIFFKTFACLFYMTSHVRRISSLLHLFFECMHATRV